MANGNALHQIQSDLALAKEEAVLSAAELDIPYCHTESYKEKHKSESSGSLLICLKYGLYTDTIRLTATLNAHHAKLPIINLIKQ